MGHYLEMPTYAHPLDLGTKAEIPFTSNGSYISRQRVTLGVVKAVTEGGTGGWRSPTGSQGTLPGAGDT